MATYIRKYTLELFFGAHKYMNIVHATISIKHTYTYKFTDLR